MRVSGRGADGDARMVTSPHGQGVAWSNASERVDLFRRMELVLQETTLQNSILTEEKAALGRKILELTANANASERPIA